MNYEFDTDTNDILTEQEHPMLLNEQRNTD